MSDYDIVIVGAGVIGLMTAYHLTNHGYKPTILEQFSLPHTRGSSHGQTRLFRFSDHNPRVTKIVQQSLEEWKQLEKVTGEQLYRNLGLMNIQDSTSSTSAALINSLDQCNLKYHVLQAAELQEKLPMFRYSDQHFAVFEHAGGIVMSDKAIRLLLKLLTDRGARILEGTKVVDIQPGSTIQLRTNRGHMTCQRLVMCPGPWAADLFKLVGLGHISVRTMPGLHCFWKVSNPDQFTHPNIPIVYHSVNFPNEPSKNRFYLLFPVEEYPGMVKYVSRGEPSPFYCHPDDRDSSSMQEMVDKLAQYSKQHIQGMADKPSIVESCMYSLTPDRRGIVGKHPKCSNIIIGAVFSGEGFKIAPVIGKALSQLTLDRPISFDLTDYSIQRFSSDSKL